MATVNDLLMWSAHAADAQGVGHREIDGFMFHAAEVLMAERCAAAEARVALWEEYYYLMNTDNLNIGRFQQVREALELVGEGEKRHRDALIEQLRVALSPDEEESGG